MKSLILASFLTSLSLSAFVNSTEFLDGSTSTNQCSINVEQVLNASFDVEPKLGINYIVFDSIAVCQDQASSSAQIITFNSTELLSKVYVQQVSVSNAISE